MVAEGASKRIRVGVGSLGLVFPDILADLHFTSCGPIEVSDRSVLPHSTRVEEIADGSCRALATYDHLVGIGHHPDGWMMAEEPLCTKCKCICELEAVGLLVQQESPIKKNILFGYTFQAHECPTLSDYGSTCKQEKG